MAASNTQEFSTLNNTKKLALSITGSTLFWTWGFGWAMNAPVYPGSPELVSTAYISSLFTSVATAIAIFFLSPQLSRTSLRKGVAAFTLLAVLGTILLATACTSNASSEVTLTLSVVAGFINGASLLFFTVLWGARYTVNGSYAGASMAISFAFAFTLNIVLGLIPQMMALPALVLSVAASSIIWLLDEKLRSPHNTELDNLSELSAGDQRLAVLPWKTLAILSSVSFVAVFFQATPVQANSHGLTITFLIAVVLSSVYAYIIWRERIRLHLRAACLMLFPTAILALVLVVKTQGEIGFLSENLLMGCAFFLHAAIWVQLIEATNTEGLSPIITFGIGNIFVTAVQAAGILLKGITQASGLIGGSWHELFAMVGIVGLVVCLASLLDSKKNHPSTGENALHENNNCTQAFSTGASSEDAIAKFAGQHNFSERETEVFSYLVKGRNISYIAEALVVTPGTIKTHTNHIYQKAQVSSRQQLITQFEQLL